MFDLKTDANSKEIVTSCHYKSEIDQILQRDHAPSLAKLQLSGQVLTSDKVAYGDLSAPIDQGTPQKSLHENARVRG